MTELYTWNPMPHRVAVTCPSCSKEATFEFAERIQIRYREDITYFQDSRHFDYEKATQGSVGLHHYAWYYHGLGRGQLELIDDLPTGYDPSFWDHSEYLYRGHGTNHGTVYCTSCDLRRKHVLNWPDDAYFSITYKESVLWAFNREMATELAAFVESNDRDLEKFRYRSSFMKIPKLFLSAKARSHVVKKLGAMML
ncbi:MAG: hypothetical protein Pars92KO_19020 [Parasphingorhabdus sp.]